MPNEPKKNGLKELPEFVKFGVVIAAGAAIYGLMAAFSEPEFVPDPLEFDAAVNDAYATTTIDLAYMSYSNDYSDICFTNPKTRGDILNCYLERPTFNFQIKGIILACKAKKPRFSGNENSAVVYVQCFSEEAKTHGLPSSYELTSFSEIQRKNYGLIGIDSDADENGNFLQPVIFGIEPLDESVPME